jgi:ADP-dependent NAD(P)H-hydrate dehydratase
MTPELPRLPPRPAESHKGDFGRVLVVAGSVGMSGAAVLCGHAALRAGAGLVKVACPAPVQPLVAQAQPCLMTTPLPADEHGQLSEKALTPLRDLAVWSSVIACGPGLGLNRGIETILLGILSDLSRPLVLDADGLNAAARLLQNGRSLPRTAAPLILTPHPGEFTRLVGRTYPPEEMPEAARQLAVSLKAVVLVKGHRTLITDGVHQRRNTTGNPGMASGGSGDVLTGVIGAFLSQGLSAFDAAVLGAHVHGLAGDLAAAERGPVGILATDLIELLPAAIKTVILP